MLNWLTRNARFARIGHQLYEMIVAQARSEAFYRELGVPDTMDGRFELIVLHMVLVLERLKREGDSGQRVGQALLERLIADMDDALRQIGIGDMGVPRRIQKTAAAVRERVAEYGSHDTAAIEAAICRNVYRTDSGALEARDGARRLASYVMETRKALDATAGTDLLAGRLGFAPAPLAA